MVVIDNGNKSELVNRKSGNKWIQPENSGEEKGQVIETLWTLPLKYYLSYPACRLYVGSFDCLGLVQLDLDMVPSVPVKELVMSPL